MANINEFVDSHLLAAQHDEAGRSSELIAHDGVLRQSVIALREGARLSAHNSPPAATIQVLKGRVRVEMGDDVQGEFEEGELWVLTHQKHSVVAIEDSAFLLTTVTSTGEPSHAG